MATAVPPTGGLKTEGENSPFPLECSLCPKKPKFSDTSHLLTHVSSKSHLHHKFNLEFKAKSEAGAREKLQRYEHWYALNGIELLLSDRIAAKGRKGSGRRGRSLTADSKARQPRGSSDSMIPSIETASGFHTPDHLPPVGYWTAVPNGQAVHISGIRNGSYIGEPMYQTPFTHGHQPPYFFPGMVSGSGPEFKQYDFDTGMDTPHSTSHTSEVDASLATGFDDDVQTNKLKGIIWPGMDIFDAATPDQKKKRNQRKDDTLINCLKSTSESVTATETVWSPEGDLERVRDIYATPSIEGTPPSTPPPPKRKHRSHTAATLNYTAADLWKEGDGDSNSGKKKRARRPTLAPTTDMRETKAAAKTTQRGSKKKKTAEPEVKPDTEDSTYPNESAKQDSFKVFYEGSGISSVGETPGAAGESTLDNRLDGNQRSRSVLHQLDPNLAINSDHSGLPYFKHLPSTRFFDGEAESTRIPFHTQAASYGSGFRGISSMSMNPLYAQSHNTIIYPPYESPMFGGNTNSETSAAHFHAAHGRRLGFGSYSMDTSNSPYGYNDQCEPGLRESDFSEQALRSTTELFEM